MDEAVVNYIKHVTIPTLQKNILCIRGGGGTEGELKEIF